VKSPIKDKQSKATAAASSFLPGRHLFHYARGKILWDPAYEFLADQLIESNLPVLDLGCGAGVFASWLRELGASFDYLGIDLSASKIEIATRCVAPKWPRTVFIADDAAGFAEGSVFDGNIVGLDLLHYFSNRDQAALLKTLAQGLATGSRLFLRNGVRDAVGWRHIVTSAEEAFVRGTSWIRGGEWNFPSRAFVEDALREAGLHVVAVPMWGNTPFSSYLFIAGKP